MGKAIGVDLGTTNSVMAVLDGDRPEVIENSDSKRLTPSVVGQSGQGELLVGEQAKAQALVREKDTINSIKRFMGLEFSHADVQRDVKLVSYRVEEGENGEAAVWLGGKRYSPPEISSFILAAMKVDAEAMLGEPVTHAVITVPAWFNSRQREATRRAGAMAGLKVMGILPEPTAAALAYGVQAQAEEPKTLLVYDLGGGTFDVTVMLVAGGVFEDLAKRGDNHLGGDDFDQKIIEWVVGEVRRLHGVDLSADNDARQKLKLAAETAKIQLSKRQRVPITIPAVAKKGNMLLDVEMELSRGQFAAMVAPLVATTIKLVYEAIEAAHMTIDGIDHILLVGGSTLSPVVEEALQQEFGKDKLLRRVNPMECVALGAAVQTAIALHVNCPKCRALNDGNADQCARCGADLYPDERPMTTCPHCREQTPLGRDTCQHCDRPLIQIGASPGVSLTQRTPHSLGVQTVGDVLEVVIPTQTIYPIPGPERTDPVVHYFTTQRPNQDFLRAPIYEGEHGTASANEYLGIVEGQLPPGLPMGTDVAMRFHLDGDGIVYVTATVPTRPDAKEISATVHIGQKLERIASAPAPGRWKREARDAIGRAEGTLHHGGKYLPETTAGKITRLQNEVEMALETENEQAGIQKTNDLKRELEQLGGLNMLIVGEAMSTSERVAPEDREEIKRLLAGVERAVVSGDEVARNRAVSALVRKIDEVIDKMPPGPDDPDETADPWERDLLARRR